MAARAPSLFLGSFPFRFTLLVLKTWQSPPCFQALLQSEEDQPWGYSPGYSSGGQSNFGYGVPWLVAVPLVLSWIFSISHGSARKQWMCSLKIASMWC